MPEARQNQPARSPAGQTDQNAGASAALVSYFDSHGRLREDLLDKEAEQVGKTLAEAGLKHSQLRRYYEEVLNLRRRLEQACAIQPGKGEEQVFLELRPEFKLLRAKAYYAHKRSSRIFPAEFKQFIERNVNSVQTARDFRAFCKHFEAVTAFHKVYAKE